MLKKAYLEISNVCNLNCSFCHGTHREKRYMTEEEFAYAAKELRKYTEYLYFHLMGEPLLHPLLHKFLEISKDIGFKVILTTNGTLLNKKKDVLLNASALHKVSISLHCYEANNMKMSTDEYLDMCIDFADECANASKICVLRLWNIGGMETLNNYILEKLHLRFNDIWRETYSGYKIKDKLFLEWGDKFDWPDMNAEDYGSHHSCYGLRDQIGVLCDGSVVPCCLDADGVITLGNIFEESLCDILSSERAVKLKASFENKNVCEELCRKCGFASSKFK